MKKLFALGDIHLAAQAIFDEIKGRKIILFFGNMGAGKTTTITAVCKLLAVDATVSSPTFSIINEYSGADDQSIYHLDLYRIKTEQEAIAAGVEDVLESGKLCIIEWPQVAANLYPPAAMEVHINVVKDDLRLLEIK